jgi:hypothetical protein
MKVRGAPQVTSGSNVCPICVAAPAEGGMASAAIATADAIERLRYVCVLSPRV